MERKRRMTEEEEDAPSTIRDRSVFTLRYKFYDARDNLHSFDINEVLKDNNYFNDNILNYFEHYSNQLSLYPKLNVNEIRKEFDHFIFNLLNTLNNYTSLKYLNTSSSYYLKDMFNPDCTFIYKNVNIKINKDDSFLQDFIVCLGNLTSPDVSLSEESIIEEILQYLKIPLKVQHREKIYGFLSNYTHIKFFYVQKKSDSNSYEYFQSEELEMFNYLSETLSSIDILSTTENTRKLGVNKDTWKIFTNFLTMNFDFYQYKGLNIDPNDDLLGDQYMITKKLGFGLTSMVYLLEKNEDNHSVEDSSHYIMKLLKESEFSKFFLNEVKKTKRLKSFNNSNKFHLFFQNILDRPSSVKYLLYEKELQCIESLSLIQAKQLIDIVHYLYDCRIIHRDISPRNLMLDRDTNHIKLIDFGFAMVCNIDNKGSSSRIVGPLTYATQSFLKFFSKLLSGREYPYCFYQPTFDLICALNIIMAMSNADIKRKIDSIVIIQDITEKISKSLKLWEDTQRTNKHYSNLLNLTKKLDLEYELDETDEGSVCDISKDESNEPSIADTSKDKSIVSDEPLISVVFKDQSAIFDVIKDEIVKLFDI